MRSFLTSLIVAVLVVGVAAPPTEAATQVGAGLDAELCRHEGDRVEIPDSFPLDACFDGSTLHVANRSSIPVVIGYSGDRGAVEKYTLDRVPSPAARVLNDAYSADPGVLLPGYALRVASGEGPLEVEARGDEAIAKRYAYLDWLARYVPIVSLGSAAVDLVNELADAWDDDQECRQDANWAGEIKCEALYLRNVGFALGRAGVSGLVGFVVGAISEVQNASRWVDDVGALINGESIRLEPRRASGGSVGGECPGITSGTWTGTWSSSAYPAQDGGIEATITVDDDVLSGTLTLSGSAYLFNGRIEGQVDCERVKFGRVDDSIEFEGELDASGTRLTGTYMVTKTAQDNGTFAVEIPSASDSDSDTASDTAGGSSGAWPTGDNEGTPAYFAWLGAGFFIPSWTSCSAAYCIAGSGDEVLVTAISPLRDIATVSQTSEPHSALAALGLSDQEIADLLAAG